MLSMSATNVGTNQNKMSYFIQLYNYGFFLSACSLLDDCSNCTDTNDNGKPDSVDECTECLPSFKLNSGKCSPPGERLWL